METINVKSTDETRVGIWEMNEEHPDGEIFVSGDKVVEVAKTSAVNRALARGLIVEVEVEAEAEAEPIVEVEPEPIVEVEAEVKKTTRKKPATEV